MALQHFGRWRRQRRRVHVIVLVDVTIDPSVWVRDPQEGSDLAFFGVLPALGRNVSEDIRTLPYRRVGLYPPAANKTRKKVGYRSFVVLPWRYRCYSTG